MQKEPIISLELNNIPLFRKGKVRNVYDLGNTLLFVTTDRISAFDVIMPNGIYNKGKVLNMISNFWFNYTKDIIDNHFITIDIDEIIEKESSLSEYRDILNGRAMLVTKTEPILVECIVRGYISGSGWKDYKNTGSISGIQLPENLKMCEKLEEPIFTPSSKAEQGHDINISQEEMKQQVGEETFFILKKASIDIYKKARDYADKKGIIIADTKFEFGKIGDKIVLIDEVLTPDSSRFWPKKDYKVGEQQKSFDKQFVRDYLSGLNWDKNPPAPVLPDDIVKKTSEKYIQAYEILTNNKFLCK